MAKLVCVVLVSFLFITVEADGFGWKSKKRGRYPPESADESEHENSAKREHELPLKIMHRKHDEVAPENRLKHGHAMSAKIELEKSDEAAPENQARVKPEDTGVIARERPAEDKHEKSINAKHDKRGKEESEAEQPAIGPRPCGGHRARRDAPPQHPRAPRAHREKLMKLVQEVN